MARLVAAILPLSGALPGIGLPAALTTAQAQSFPQPDATERAYWESIRNSRNPADFQAYLAAYPTGVFVPLARFSLNRLRETQGGVPSRPGTGAMGGSADGTATRPVPLAPPRPLVVTDPAVLRRAQSALYNLNYDVRYFSGIYDAKTRAAISAYQGKLQLPQTGTLTVGQFVSLTSVAIPTVWGALAYTARGASGTVWQRKTRAQAERDALAECRKRADGARCDVVSVANSSCAVMTSYRATMESGVQSGANATVRPTLSEARQASLAHCAGRRNSRGTCQVRISVCANGAHRAV